MNDSFIESLKGEWQTIDAGPGVDFESLRKQFARKRFLSILIKGLEFIATIGAVAAGIFLALTVGGWLGWASAIMLVFMLSALFVWGYRVWRPSLHWEDQGPEGTVAFGCRNIESSLKTVRIMKVHCWSLVIFVSVLWILQFSGLIGQAEFLVIFTTVCAIVVAVLWVFLGRREKRLKPELERYRALLEELRNN